MSDRAPISPENLPTVVAVGAITAILALAYGIYLNRQIQVVAVGATALDVRAARRDVAIEKEIDALKKRIEELEAARAPTTVAGAAEGTSAPVTP